MSEESAPRKLTLAPNLRGRRKGFTVAAWVPLSSGCLFKALANNHHRGEHRFPGGALKQAVPANPGTSQINRAAGEAGTRTRKSLLGLQ